MPVTAMGKFVQGDVPDVRGIGECWGGHSVVELACFTRGEATCHFCDSLELLHPTGGCSNHFGDVWSPGKFWIEEYSKILVIIYCCDDVR